MKKLTLIFALSLLTIAGFGQNRYWYGNTFKHIGFQFPIKLELESVGNGIEDRLPDEVKDMKMYLAIDDKTELVAQLLIITHNWNEYDKLLGMRNGTHNMIYAMDGEIINYIEEEFSENTSMGFTSWRSSKDSLTSTSFLYSIKGYVYLLVITGESKEYGNPDVDYIIESIRFL